MRLQDLTLLHYGPAVVTEMVDASTRTASRKDRYFKPDGLWVSVKGDRDWEEWCRSENFRDMDAAIVTQIVLKDNANILHLADEDDIDRFTERYRLAVPQYRGDRSIDWPRAAEDFDGIIIAPYCWPRRMSHHTTWYYSWDCASGCIWKARAVAGLVADRVTA